MQTPTPITLESVPVLSWEARSRPEVIRTKRWYIAASVVVFVVAAYSILTGSWTLAVVSVLAGGMYALIHDHTPPIAHIELFDSGIRLDNAFIRWDELTGFWILQTPAYNELRFVARRPHKRLVIQTGTQDLAELRMILGQRLPELVTMRENILDLFIRICKL